MKKSGQKFIFLSFIFALIATAILFVYLQSIRSSKTVVKKTSILIAAETIPARTLIEKKMIKEVQISDNTIFNEYIKDYTQIVGKYSKETISKDEGFFKDKLISENGSELSLNIEKDNRAISLNVSQDAGVSELIKPGDFVDIITFLAEKKDGTKIIRPEMAKIVLQNIEVIAIDKQLNRDDTAKDQTKTANNFLVTLSVKTSDLEKLVLAQSIGSIKLALRPIKSNSTSITNGATWEQLTVNETTNSFTNTNNENNLAQNKNSNSYDESYKIYTVKRGDNLKKISSFFYGTPDKYILIKEANKIENGNLIITGEVIKIPVLD